MKTVRDGHERLLASKREELSEIVRQCMQSIHMADDGSGETKSIITNADNYYSRKREEIAECRSLALLDGLQPQMLQYKDDTEEMLEAARRPSPAPQAPLSTNGAAATQTAQPKKIYKTFNRSILFPAKLLENEAEIDEYVDKMRDNLKQLLKNCDGIRLK